MIFLFTGLGFDLSVSVGHGPCGFSPRAAAISWTPAGPGLAPYSNHLLLPAASAVAGSSGAGLSSTDIKPLQEPLSYNAP